MAEGFGSDTYLCFLLRSLHLRADHRFLTTLKTSEMLTNGDFGRTSEFGVR